MNNRGFSLIQVMVSLAIVSATSLLLLRLQENNTKVTDASQYRIEVSQFIANISSALTNKDFCAANFKDLTLGVNRPTTINSIRPNNEVGSSAIVEVGKTYGFQNTIKVVGMSIVPVVLDPTIETIDKTRFKFIVNIERQDRKKGAAQTINRSFDIYASINENNTVENCSVGQTTNDSSVESACHGPGAIYNSISNICEISSIGEVPECPKGQALKYISYDYVSNRYNAECAVVLGAVSCQGTEVLKGFDEAGNPNCIDPLNTISGLGPSNIDLHSLIDLTEPTCGVNVRYKLDISPNNKIRLVCGDTATPPAPAACSCQSWGSWYHIQTGAHDTGSGFEPYRTKCKFERVCTGFNVTPCTGRVASQVSAWQIHLNSNGGGKFRRASKAASQSCPTASFFGL